MELKLEQLKYQQRAIQSVVSVFKGQERNTFDNVCIEGIRSNILTLMENEIIQNIKDVLLENGLGEETGNIQKTNDLCVEMETGTGKTLVYIKTVFELFKHYGFTKFIILVPSVAIKEGVLTTLKTFEKQLEDIYNMKPGYFEYDSKRLAKVMNFVEKQYPQIMVMTLQSFNPDFGLVLKKRNIRAENENEYYFVIETKGTNRIDDRKALTANEIYKIKCAIKHFEALGIEAKACPETDHGINYIAPVKEYSTFKNRAAEIIQ